MDLFFRIAIFCLLVVFYALYLLWFSVLIAKDRKKNNKG